MSFLKKSMGKTLKESSIVKNNSEGKRGAVRSMLPPRYVKSICIAPTASIIKIKAAFSVSPENIRRLSVLQLKQLQSEEKINRAKNAVKRYML